MVVAVESAHTLENKVDPVAAQHPAPGRDSRTYDRGWSSEFYRLPDVTTRVAVSGTGEVPLTGTSGDVLVGAGDTNRIAGAPESTNPGDTEALTALKFALKFKKENIDKARKMFQKALNLSPKNHDILVSYGEFLEDTENPEDAYQCYLKALLSIENPEKSPAWQKREDLLPFLNELDMQIPNTVDLILFIMEFLTKIIPMAEDTISEEIDVEHIYHPCSSTSIALPCEPPNVVEGPNAESENTIEENSTIAGINKAISRLNEIWANKEKITIEDVKNIHKEVMEPSCPTVAGKIREGPVYVNGHTPPPASDVKDLMDIFIALLEDPRTRYKHPLHIAAFAHYILVDIHPFEDGNGRTARLLMNLILRKYKYPPIHIKEWDEYSEHLKTANEGHFRLFIRFIALTLFCHLLQCLVLIIIITVIILLLIVLECIKKKVRFKNQNGF